MSDNPNVNKLFLNLLAETREEEQRSILVDLGTCGLHILHNGFQHGGKTSGWELKSLLNVMFKIFDESSAMRADNERFNFVLIDRLKMRVAERTENVWEKYL